MKTKILLLVSLVLIALQGWAVPVDSCNEELYQIRYFNYCNESNQLNIKEQNQDHFLELKKNILDSKSNNSDLRLKPFYNDTSERNQLSDSTSASLQWYVIPTPWGPIPLPESVQDLEDLNTLIQAGLIVAQSTAGVLLLPPIVGFSGTVDLNTPKTIPVQGIIPPGTELAVSLIDPSGSFSVWATGVSPEDVLAGRTKLMLNYNPSTEGSHEAILAVGHDLFWMHVLLLGEAKKRTINVSTEYVSFPNHVMGEEAEIKSFTVDGENLKGSLTVDYDGPEGVFTVNKSSITANEALNETTVDVTYNPQEAGTHNATIKICGGSSPDTRTIFLSGSADYREITVSDNSLMFGNAIVGDQLTKKFTATGTNLTGPMNVQLEDQSNMFSIQEVKTTTDQNKTNITVTIAYTPTIAGTHNATILLSGSGAENKTVSLHGTGVSNQSIDVTPSTYDFGTEDMGEEKTKEFTVIGNNLNAPISIDMDLETNGGEYTFAPTSLPPSGGTVTVTFKPVYNGSSGAAFTLTSGQASAHFAVTGTCVIPPHISPSTTSLDFGTVDKGKEKTKTFNVAGTSLTGNLTLTTNSSYYTVSPATITPAEARTNPTVTVTYKPTAGGNHDAILSISGGGADSKTINLSGKCVAIDVTPSTYDFGTVNKGEEKTKKFTVIGTNLSAPISIDMDLETNGGEYTFSPTSLPSSGGTVTVTFKPVYNGSSGAAFTLTSGQASGHFAVTGTCIKPNISVNPTSLAFGNVVKGNNPTKTFKVTGTDLTGNLTVSSSNSTYFTVSPTTITAAQAKAGATVTVTYKASAEGSHSGTITISGGGASPQTVNVSGKCVVPAISVSPTSIAFGTVGKGQQVDKSFWVTGSYLTGSLTVSSNNSNFIVSPTSISAAEAAEGKMVTVTYKPTAVGSHSGTITISGGGASPKTVSVSGKCVVPEISVSTTSLLFEGNYDSRTFRVTGTNLTGSLTLTSNNSIFTVTPSTITASQAANGVTVKVQCNAATNIQRASGKITISGGGASPKYVNLTLDASNVQPNAPMVEPEGEGEDGNDRFNNGELIYANGSNSASVNELDMNSKIYADRLNIIIESPVEQKAVISDIAGHIREVNLQAGRNEIPVNASGIYIVRIREKSTKLMLK